MPGCISFLSGFLSSTYSAKESRMGTWVWCPKLPFATHPALHGGPGMKWIRILCLAWALYRATEKLCHAFAFCSVFLFLLFFNFQTVIIVHELASPLAYFGVSFLNLGLLSQDLNSFIYIQRSWMTFPEFVWSLMFMQPPKRSLILCMQKRYLDAWNNFQGMIISHRLFDLHHQTVKMLLSFWLILAWSCPTAELNIPGQVIISAYFEFQTKNKCHFPQTK